MNCKGRILLFTGDGKGKTTAALGMVLRASGHNLRSLVIQFIKASEITGEMAACRHLPGVEIVQVGKGFVPPADSPLFRDHREAAYNGLDRAAQEIEKGAYDMIILDEICTALARDLLDEDAILDAFVHRNPGTCIVMTGRGASARLVALADTVTEMVMVKHGLADGIAAQKGVEY